MYKCAIIIQGICACVYIYTHANIGIQYLVLALIQGIAQFQPLADNIAQHASVLSVISRGRPKSSRSQQPAGWIEKRLVDCSCYLYPNRVLSNYPVKYIHLLYTSLITKLAIPAELATW